MAYFPRNDLTGKTFGKLTVIAFAGRRPGGYGAMWTCRCTCGGESTVRADHLNSGASTTCGCGVRRGLLEANTTHGKHKTPEYRVWAGMHTRCYNDKEKTWPHYGGRGIEVCKHWRGEGKFQNFLADMGLRPSAKHSIERLDNDGNYEPKNCQWVTRDKQVLNKRNTLYFEKVPLKISCAAMGVNYYSARARLRKGQAPFERRR